MAESAQDSGRHYLAQQFENLVRLAERRLAKARQVPGRY
jgi:hypothetical protein